MNQRADILSALFYAIKLFTNNGLSDIIILSKYV